MSVTFQVLEGIDKGRIFRDLPLSPPLTIGREEGNLLRLNDERVSRFHVKIQQDNGDVILTDLESTNGTRVNGKVVQIRRLRPGDRIGIGRSLLLFGSGEEIAARLATLAGLTSPSTDPGTGLPPPAPGPTTLPAPLQLAQLEQDLDFDLNVKQPITHAHGNLFIGGKPLPPLPQKMSPAQAARLAEILDFLHSGLTSATENIEANEEGTEIGLQFIDWQRILAIQLLLARYLRAIAEPEVFME